MEEVTKDGGPINQRDGLLKMIHSLLERIRPTAFEQAACRHLMLAGALGAFHHLLGSKSSVTLRCAGQDPSAGESVADAEGVVEAVSPSIS